MRGPLMTTPIRAIETSYQGYRFRSRLEARWAVFFDALGLPWEYEKEGYDLPSGKYLPDFWLPSLECWAEIKPGSAVWPDDFRLTWELAQAGGRAWVLAGNPWPGEHRIHVMHDYRDGLPEECEWHYDCLTECRRCNGLCLLADGDSFPGPVKYYGFSDIGRHTCGDHDKWPSPPEPGVYAERVYEACAAARGARFEHGENGPPGGKTGPRAATLPKPARGPGADADAGPTG